jgi:hypothetical protein
MKFDGKWPEVKSSNIQAVSYSAYTKTLKVRFRSGEYRYEDVPADVVEKFITADSIGKAFYQYIKDDFKAKRMEKADEK